jgi:hypothetical protein
VTCGISPQCYSCDRLLPLVPGAGWTCSAFEKGIPKAILVNAADHREPYLGDGGLRFEAHEVKADAAKEIESEGAPIGSLHPGVGIALRRAGMNEYDISQAIRDGELASPVKFENSWFFAMRITGTNTAYRDALNEHVYRPPEHYLTPYFLERAKGLPVIWEHPPGLSLNTDEYRERSVGGINGVTWIDGDEVWGIARIIDGDAADWMIEHPEVSTSPAVVFRKGDGNQVVGMTDGKHLLIEGDPTLLDHLAICELGTWDKQGPPRGVDVSNGEARMDDDKTRKDAAEEKLDKILAGLGSVADAVKAHADRMDKMDRRLDARDDDDRKRDDAKRKDEEAETEKRQSAELERLAKEEEHAAEEEEAKADDDHRKADDDKKRDDAAKRRDDARHRRDRAGHHMSRRDDESCDDHSKRMDAGAKKGKFPAFMKRDDETCEEHSERMDKAVRDHMRSDAHRDDRKARDDDRKKRDDAAAEEPPKDPLNPESTNDSKKDDDKKRDDKKRDDKKRDDDDDKSRKDSVDVKALLRRIEDQDKLLKQVAEGHSETDKARLAEIQERADAVFHAFNEQAPEPMRTETEMGYRLRLARKLQRHSKVWKDEDLAILAKHAPKAFANTETAIYADATAASSDPSTLPEDVLIEYKVPRPGGLYMTEFRGRGPKIWMAQFMPPKRVVRSFTGGSRNS